MVKIPSLKFSSASSSGIRDAGDRIRFGTLSVGGNSDGVGAGNPGPLVYLLGGAAVLGGVLLFRKLR